MVDAVTNPLEMSDEDFAKLPIPGEEVSEQTTEASAEAGADGVSGEESNNADQQQQGSEAGEEGKQAEGAEGTGAEAQGAEGQGDGAGAGKQAGAEGAEGGAAQPKAEEQQGKEGAEAPKPEGAVSPTGSKPEGQEAPAAGVVVRTADTDKAFYDKVMAPFIANGKEIKLNSPEEVIQLMQQGANYTRKMQAIAPHRKMLTMAQNNGITEDKLSFLIDLEKGNPEAIQKFLKDKGVDPLSIDTESEPTYREGTHKVSDTEVAFRTNLDELSSTPEGKETLQTINSTWDDASKEVLWGEPALMTVIHAQRESGVYDLITTEVDRRRMLGQIAPDTSFFDAYRMVGDDLVKKAEAEKAAAPAPTAVAPVPVATTAAAPKATVENGDKASAASPTRSTPKPAKVNFNPLAMSDEEFEAQFAKMQGRV